MGLCWGLFLLRFSNWISENIKTFSLLIDTYGYGLNVILIYAR